jgi:hypothetical protein
MTLSWRKDRSRKQHNKEKKETEDYQANKMKNRIRAVAKGRKSRVKNEASKDLSRNLT